MKIGKLYRILSQGTNISRKDRPFTSISQKDLPNSRHSPVGLTNNKHIAEKSIDNLIIRCHIYTVYPFHQLRDRSSYGPCAVLLISADHRATDFSIVKTFDSSDFTVKMLRRFFAILVMKSGARTIKHIFFVSLDIYLHSSIYTYLLIFISSSLSYQMSHL